HASFRIVVRYLRLTGIVADRGRKLPLIGVATVDGGETDLLEVVLALDACRSLADFLHGRQQQPNQDGNDGDHHQQLDQRESTPTLEERQPWHKSTPLKKSKKKGELLNDGNPSSLLPEAHKEYETRS